MIQLNVLLKVLLIAGLLITAAQIYTIGKDPLINSVEEKGFTSTFLDVMAIGVGLESTTPIFEFEWIGSEDKKTPWLESIPVPSFIDLILVIGYISFASWITRIIGQSDSNLAVATILYFLVWVAGFYFAYIMWKILIWQLALWRAESIGLGYEALNELRKNRIANQGNAALSSLVTIVWFAAGVIDRYLSRD